MTVKNVKQTFFLLISLLSLGAVVSSCSGKDQGVGPHGQMEMKSGISVAHPWVRAVPPSAKHSGAFMVLKNNTGMDDALTGGESDVAKAVEIHQTSRGAKGMMEMNKVSEISIASGASVELKPGSYHIMLIGLKKKIKKGDSVQLTLHFRHAGKVMVNATAQEGPGMKKSMKH